MHGVFFESFRKFVCSNSKICHDTYEFEIDTISPQSIQLICLMLSFRQTECHVDTNYDVDQKSKEIPRKIHISIEFQWNNWWIRKDLQ